MDAMELLFKARQKAINAELKDVEDGTHPEVQKIIENAKAQYEQLINSHVPAVVYNDKVAMNHIYEAEVNLANKQYADSREELREKMLRQLAEERVQAENDYISDELESSDGLFMTPIRNLRKRFNDMPASPESGENIYRARRVLSAALPPSVIEKHVRFIRGSNKNDEDYEDVLSDWDDFDLTSNEADRADRASGDSENERLSDSQPSSSFTKETANE